MMDYNKEDIEKISPDNFEFVQHDEKIYDKKFQTKPVGYFKDAMIRFTKNKTNVIATIILFFLVLMSILVPMLSTKNYKDFDSRMAKLPPKMPIIEKLGIFDGTRKYTDQTADLTLKDPATGLYLPLKVDPNYIVKGTLKNYNKACSSVDDTCRNGQINFKLNKESLDATYSLNTKDYQFDFSQDKNLTLDVYSVDGNNTELKVISTLDNENNVTVLTINQPGVYNIDMSQYAAAATSNNTAMPISLELSSTSLGGSISFNSITVAGQKFADYDITQAFKVADAGTGIFQEQNGKMIETSYRYDEYAFAFGPYPMIMGKEEYDDLIAKNANVCTPTPNPYYPNDDTKWVFKNDNCPVMRVDGKTSIVKIGNQEYYSYRAVVNYRIYKGYDSIPNFLFGTTAEGQDFFARLWLGLRTSLFVGVIVAIINITIGVIYGSIEGYYGGKVDLLMERFAEIVGRIPWLVWLALFLVILGPGVKTLIILLTITGWLGVASITRTQFYRYKRREYVLASRTLGAKDSRLIFRHILPNGIGTIITTSILMIPQVIFVESTVSFLGFGIGHGQSFKLFGFIQLSGVSIGVLLSDGRTELINNHGVNAYLLAFPAVIIAILMITFNMFGNALRDAFNPSLRGSE